MLALLVFFLAINYLVISQQRTLMISENKKYIENEINSFSRLTESALLKKDYANIEHYVSEWGSETSQILEIMLEAKNGFVIAMYKRQAEAQYPISFTKSIEYSSDSTAKLTVIVSQDELQNGLVEVAVRLTMLTVFLVIAFGFIFWKILLRTAILPLQTEMSEHEKTSTQLHEALVEARAATVAKSEFVANMSHEIRTPMNGVLGMLSLLKDTELDDIQKEYAYTAYSSAESLLILLNDILDSSKIDAGKLEFENVDFSVRDMTEEVASLFADSAHKNGLEMVCNIHNDVPAMVIGDPTRSRQVLANLMSNAIKFTEQGEISIDVQKVTEHDREYIKFVVTDTGVGIDNDKLQYIFDQFSQEDASTTRKYGGTGLGLSISKKLAELMGGEIGARSEQGVGSTFWFTIGLNKSSVIVDSVHPGEHLSDVRVLIVDDNATNRKILEHQLTSWGIEHTSAESGEAAITEYTRGITTNEPYKLILLDMMMPGMHGVEVATILSERYPQSSHKVIMLTSGSLSDYIDDAKKAGVNHYLNKPVRQSVLCDAMMAALMGEGPELVKVSEEDEVSQVPSDDLAQSSLKILIAEDNVINQKVASGMIRKLGFSPDMVSNGQEAVRAIENGDYDLIFMDCHMPEMDGYEATKAIRVLEGDAKHIIIVALTANAMKGDREKCISVGMDDYISKPLRIEQVSEIVGRWFYKDNEMAREV